MKKKNIKKTEILRTHTIQWTERCPQVLGEFQRVVWRRTDVMMGFTHNPDTADKLSRHGAYQASATLSVYNMEVEE